MVTYSRRKEHVTKTSDVDRMADELTDRLVRRGCVPASLRESARAFMREELLRSLRKVARRTSANAGVAVAVQRVLGSL